MLVEMKTDSGCFVGGGGYRFYTVIISRPGTPAGHVLLEFR